MSGGGATTMAWPIALVRDVHPAGLVRGRLDGYELLIWRGDDDTIRVWEDRCPHRSVRLSAGRNLGDSVQDIYHGWRLDKDGAVLAIPAEQNAARPDMGVRVFKSVVAFDLVWASVDGAAIIPSGFTPAKGDVALRPLPINAPAATAQLAFSSLEDMRLIATPADGQSCRVFGLADSRRGETPLQAARRCNHRLNALRRALETGAPS